MPLYNPSHFVQSDPDAQRQLIAAHPLATLVIHAAAGLEAHHIPLHAIPPATEVGDDRWRLRGHVARANPLWRDIGDGCPALAVFHGPQGYVTPSWYASKARDGKVVPTWNYAVVHAHGRLTAHDDPRWVHALVTRLTDQAEAPRPAPWAVTDAPSPYVEQMLRALVGIELRVERFEGKWKLSQNRSQDDRDGVVRGLADPGDPHAQAELHAWIDRAQRGG
ncbi:MAG: FMN-binding negative transcriptional regulator [Burkholderiales bacterium]|nr:FMN-binding negative transcriptional regulator [Burkholderiales bacterium]